MMPFQTKAFVTTDSDGDTIVICNNCTWDDELGLFVGLVKGQAGVLYTYVPEKITCGRCGFTLYRGADYGEGLQRP